MKFNELNKDTTAHTRAGEVQLIEDKLSDAELHIKEAIKASFEQISKNSSCENELVALWGNYMQNLSDYFFQLSEETNNKSTYKKVVRHLMFKKG
jgi:hypothetical protein